MPSIGGVIVVGGGIALGSPAVIGNFLKLTSASPAVANVSLRLIERSTSIELLGDGTTSTAIGTSADANDTDHIAIGRNVVTRAGALRSLLIGNDIVPPVSSGNDEIYIGSVTFGVLAGSSSIGIGYGISTSSTANSSSVCVGHNAALSGNSHVAIGASVAITGNGSVAIGASASAALNSISIGQLATSGTGGSANNLIIGNSATGPVGVSGIVSIGNRNTAGSTGVAAGDILLGHQDNANSVFSLRLVLGGGRQHSTGVTVPAFTIRNREANGTNIGAGDLTIEAPLASGNATGGGIALATAPSGASGAIVQTPVTRVRVEPTGNITLAAATGSYGSGVGVIFIGNAGTNPSANPVGGGILYVNAGALTYRGSGGTVTVIAPA